MTTKIRAKFVVESVTHRGNDSGCVELSAVTGGSEENESFWKYTPAGKINMHIDNVVALKAFVPGNTYYVDFTPAPTE